MQSLGALIDPTSWRPDWHETLLHRRRENKMATLRKRFLSTGHIEKRGSSFVLLREEAVAAPTPTDPGGQAPEIPCTRAPKELVLRLLSVLHQCVREPEIFAVVVSWYYITEYRPAMVLPRGSSVR